MAVNQEILKEYESLLSNNFLWQMALEIYANREKGDWKAWTPDKESARSELQHHVNKLLTNLDNDSLVREYSADVANIAMKIAETFG